MKRTRIVVDSEFKKLLKMRSAEEDLTLLELTSKIAKKEQYPEFFNLGSKNKRKKGGRDFGFTI